jgi:hypothetical protein
MTDDETIALRATVIAGQRHIDDYAVIWRGMPIGRIMCASGAASDKPQWSWNCYVHGKPSSADDSGTGHYDLDDAKAKFRAAWAYIRAGLTDADIARAQRSAEASARYDRKAGRMIGAIAANRPALESHAPFILGGLTRRACG